MEFFNKAHSGLFAYALYAWDIVGRIAHKRFNVNKLIRCNSVTLLHRSVIIDGRFIIALPGNGQNYLCLVRRKLQIVLVASGDKALYLALLANARNGAYNIVSLVAFLFKNCHAHRTENVLAERHLRHQALRHRLALRFVAVIAQMAEGRRF